MVDGQIRLFPEDKRVYMLSQIPSIDKQGIKIYINRSYIIQK